MNKHLGIVNILEPVFLDTLFQETGALRARIGFDKLIQAFQPRVSRDTHNIHIGTPKIMDIAELFDDVFLRVNTSRRIAGTTAPGSEAVCSLGDDFTAFNKGGHVNTGEMGVAQINSPSITDNLI